MYDSEYFILTTAHLAKTRDELAVNWLIESFCLTAQCIDSPTIDDCLKRQDVDLRRNINEFLGDLKPNMQEALDYMVSVWDFDSWDFAAIRHKIEEAGGISSLAAMGKELKRNNRRKATPSAETPSMKPDHRPKTPRLSLVHSVH